MDLGAEEKQVTEGGKMKGERRREEMGKEVKGKLGKASPDTRNMKLF